MGRSCCFLYYTRHCRQDGQDLNASIGRFLSHWRYEGCLKYIYCIFLISKLPGFLFGYDSGIITSTIGQSGFIKYFDNPSDNVTGGIVSAFQGGAILGTIINVFTGDRLKLSVFAGACVSCFGCALQAGSVNMVMLIIGRFIAGVAVGVLTSVVPMYAGEMAESSTRGMMSGLLQWMLSWGYLIAQWLGYGCSFVNNPFQCKSFTVHYFGLNYSPIVFRAFPACIPVHSWYHPGLRYLVLE